MNRPVPTLDWPVAPAGLRLAQGEVHVWAASLAVSPAAVRALGDTLAPDERERAAKFHFDRHRGRYIAGRGLLRRTLAGYLSADPACIQFVYSATGKPELAREFAGSEIHFNLAHSEDLAAFAVTRIGPVGVDVEHIREMKDMEALAARFFSRRESEVFQKLPVTAKPAAFFDLWTRKEALLKATGEGIAGGLHQVEVSFLPGEPARVVSIDGDDAKGADWFLRDLSPAPGYAGSVAVRGRCTAVRCWQ